MLLRSNHGIPDFTDRHCVAADDEGRKSILNQAGGCRIGVRKTDSGFSSGPHRG
jgi:hypothetical protein